MKHIYHLLILAFVLSCSTNSNTEETLPSLNDIRINRIENIEGELFFCTSDGIFIKTQKGFKRFGLSGKSIVDIVKVNDNYLAAKQALDFGTGEITLFLKKKGKWNEYLRNYGGIDNLYTWIVALESSKENSNVIYSTGGANILKSENGGNSWEEMFNNWDSAGFAYFLEIQGSDSDTIWFGGSNVVSFPTLIRSTDGGESWDRLTVLENVQTESYSIVFNSEDSNQLMVSLGGVIRKSIDFGEEWSSVYEGPFAFYSLTQSTVDPLTIYASGRNIDQDLFFLKSEDFGENWQLIELENSAEDVFVIDMESVIKDGKEVLYLGTNKGLFSYILDN